MKPHTHHVPAGAEHATGADRLAAQVDACPLCRAHDHTNDDPFGYDRDRQPIPAWWFCCPRCGTAETQVHVTYWTKDGIEWLKNHPDHHGTTHKEQT